MTEAMSRREIEDILTSIRKLVSHDPAGAFAPVQRPERDAALMGKLVLTSALRVTETPADEKTAAATDAPSALPDWPTAAMLEESAPFGADQTQDVYPLETETSASLLSRITRSAGASTTAPSVTPIVAGGAGNIDAAPQDLPLALADAQDWLDDADIPLPMPEAGDDVAQDTADTALEETLARLEAMLSGQTIADTSPAATPFVTAADTVQVQPDEQPAKPEKAENTAAEPDDAATIDEAMLYQLVANIVRQELQGELGEKITRAIRKLVRSEVARELQLRNM